MDRRRSSSTDDSSARPRRRGRSRGIASLEGLIVIPCLAIFLIAMPFTYRLFATWYELQAGTRERTLDTASKGCGGGGSGSESLDLGGSTDETRQVAAQKGDQDALDATEPKLNGVSTVASRVVALGPFSAIVEAKSHGSCSETPRKASTQDWSQFGFEQHRGQGTGDYRGNTR
jgi:hypothetical protein